MGRSIAIVEDEPSIRANYVEALNRFGYDARGYASRQEASSAFAMRLPELAFLSWAGLRGAVPIIMATVPLASPLPQARDLFDLVFVFVVVYTTLQAPTLEWMARRLGLTTGDDAVDIEVEVAPLDKIQADFMQIKVPAGSHLHGVTVFELRLPPHFLLHVYG